MAPFIILLGFLIPPLLGMLANGYALPGRCYGACNIHDPALIRRDDGRYYRFSTGNRISYASAPSISGPWTGHGSVVAAGSSINLPGNQDLWVHKHLLFTKILDIVRMFLSVIIND
jgi:arabinan endo-1,5-alpha-L-arabinosidase